MNKPIQYQKGYVEFYKLKFKVTPDVLIPRPETELLVDEVIKIVMSKSKNTHHPITIFDIGTGAGNIAVSIAKNTPPDVNIIAIDVSPKALKVARQNAKLHGVEHKIKFITSNLLSNLPYTLNPNPFTLMLVTNLPYIPSARIPYLDSSVKDFEPYIALDGGEDGFELYRKLFQQIHKSWGANLSPPLGWKVHIVCEIDYTHGELAILEALKYFPTASVEVKKDLAHKQRILTITA